MAIILLHALGCDYSFSFTFVATFPHKWSMAHHARFDWMLPSGLVKKIAFRSQSFDHDNSGRSSAMVAIANLRGTLCNLPCHLHQSYRHCLKPGHPFLASVALRPIPSSCSRRSFSCAPGLVRERVHLRSLETGFGQRSWRTWTGWLCYHTNSWLERIMFHHCIPMSFYEIKAHAAMKSILPPIFDGDLAATFLSWPLCSVVNQPSNLWLLLSKIITELT